VNPPFFVSNEGWNPSFTLVWGGGNRENRPDCLNKPRKKDSRLRGKEKGVSTDQPHTKTQKKKKYESEHGCARLQRDQRGTDITQGAKRSEP